MSEKMEHYPALPTSATHRVSVNSRLALRDGPAFLSSSDSAHEDNHIKGAIVEMLSNGTRLIVIDEAVGYECSWAQVLVEGKSYGNKKLFTSNKYIKALTSTPHSAPFECGEKSVGKPSSVPLLDWTKGTPGEVILDEHFATFKVIVELSDSEYVSTGGGDINKRLKEATTIGLKAILKHAGKNSEDDYVISLISEEYFQFVRATDYFVDTKPNTYLKVLVCLPYRYVPPLEDAKGVVVTSSGHKSDTAWNSLENVALRSSYNTNELPSDIENVSKLFEGYSQDISKYQGGLVNFDISLEAERLRSVLPPLSRLLKDNGIKHDPFTKNEKLEIGWDNTLTPVFVSLTKEDGSVVAMASGMEKFADTPPIDSQRTQGYLWQLNLLRKRKQSSMPWTEFITTFTQPSPPIISPSLVSAVGDISDVIGVAKKAAQSLNDSPVKTFAEKLQEDSKLGDLDFKNSLYEDRKSASDFVGSSLASCEGLQATLNKIDTVDDAFSLVLDKISIADLIKQCMDNISANLPPTPDLDVPDVNLDYDYSAPSMPSVQTNLNLSGFGDMSLGSLNMGSLNFGSLGLGEMTIEDLGIGSMTLAEFGLGSMSIDSLNIGEIDIGALGLDISDLNLSSVSLAQLDIDIARLTIAVPAIGALAFQDVDFGDMTVGDLGIDLSSLTVGELGLGEMTLCELNLSIEDFGLTTSDVSDLTPVEIDTPPSEVCNIKLNLLGMDDSNVEELGLDLSSLPASALELPGLSLADFDLNLSALTLGNFDLDLNGVSFSSLNLNNFSMDELNLSAFDLSGLGLSSFSIDSLNLSSVDFSSLGLENINMSSLGLSMADVAGLSDVLKDLGIEETLSKLDGLTDVDISSISELADDLGLSEEMNNAKEKLKNLAGEGLSSLSPFDQGTPKMPKSLAISLPDNLPTLDIMSSVSDAVESALTSLLNELFVGMVKGVLQSMLNECDEESSDHNGKENLGEMIDDSLASTNGGRGRDSILDDLIAGLGLVPGVTASGSPTAPGDVPREKRDKVNDLLDDVSLMFTPRELCTLINNRASTRTITLARRMISKKYPEFNLRSRSSITDFFKALGTAIDPSICALIEEPIGDAQSPILGDVLCPPSDIEELRTNLLENKGDGITAEQITNQLKKARQRKIDSAKLLADMVNKGPLSDSYSPPPIFCQKGAPRSANNPANASLNNAPGMDKQGGLIDLSHPSIDFAMEKNVDNLFTPLYITFSNDVRLYPEAFIDETVDTTSSTTVPLYISEGVINPTALHHYGSESAAVAAAKGDELTVSNKIKKAQSSLYESLRQMETSDLLEFKEFDSGHVSFKELEEAERTVTGGDDNISFTNGGYGVEIDLPDISNSAIEELKSQMGEINNDAVSASFDSMLTKMSAAKSTYSLCYILPILTEEQINDGSYDDVYVISIIEKNSSAPEPERIIYRQAVVGSSSEELVSSLRSERFQGRSIAATTTSAQHKFATLVHETWAEASTEANAATLYESSTNKLFPEISRDLFAFVSQRIANSPFFQSVEPSSALSGDTKISSSLPVIEFLNLDPEQTAQQQVDGIDPHLLGLQEEKKCLLDNAKKTQCVDFSVPTDGTAADEMTDLEKEIMNTCIKLIVRTYMIDYYMKGLFVNSVFKMPDHPEEAYTSHLVSKILSDMRAYDTPNFIEVDGGIKPVSPQGSYEDDFSIQIIRMYKPPEEDVTDDAVGGEVTVADAIKQQVEAQYNSVNNKMLSVVSSLMIDDIDNQFLNSYLKRVKIPDYGSMGSKFFEKGEDDFLEVITSEFDDISALRDNAAWAASQGRVSNNYGTDFAEFTNVKQSSGNTLLDDTRDIDYTNGHMFLEEYYYLEDLEEPSEIEIWTSDMSDTEIFSKRKCTFSEEVTNPKYYKYFGTVAPDDFQALRKDLPDGYAMLSTDTLKGAFKSVKRGIRVMYVPPTAGDKMVSYAWEGSEEPSIKVRFQKAWSLMSSASGDEFHEASKSVSLENAVKAKAYRVIEQIQGGALSDVLYSGAVTVTAGGEEKTQKSYENDAWSAIWQATNPFPIIKKEWSLPSSALSKPESSAFEAEVLASFTSLLTDSDFGILIKHIFPISRMKSILEIYNHQVSELNPDISNAMSDTKDELRRIFFAINLKGDYKQKDPALDAIGGEAGLNKMIQNEFGVRDMPASPNSWNMNMPVGWGKTVKGVGFGAVAKATKDAVLKIFKQQTEKHDPNISLAHKLAIATKMANVNIPTTAWSFMVLPANVFPGIGFGPPITPLTIAYHSLGLGLWKQVQGAEDESSKEISEQLEKLGFSPDPLSPDSCEETE